MGLTGFPQTLHPPLIRCGLTRSLPTGSRPSGTSLRSCPTLLHAFAVFQRNRATPLPLQKSELNKGNIPFPQFFLLTYLSSEEYLTISDIATKMGHSTAAATGLVDRLEKHGYIERICAADDRRKVMVRITAKGVELVSRMRQEIAADLGKILSGMQEEEPTIIQGIARFVCGSKRATRSVTIASLSTLRPCENLRN
jgi:DNA-binding MarR family transcriptional regulator